MYIIQTTSAILIAFLALLAWSEVKNRLTKGRTRKKDLETPVSPLITATNDNKTLQLIHDRDSDVIVQTHDKAGLRSYKELYFQLHHLEEYPHILPKCWDLLVSFLASTISEALENRDEGILTIQSYSPEALNAYLKTKDVGVTDRWQEYLERRKNGGLREMFGDKAEAEWWLKQAAPVKFVDGAWLGHINNISTPFQYRHITKNAWQVMSEELGDGDLAKNHVQVYQDLMQDINAGLPAADSEDFIHPRHDLNEVRCWKAAMAQLLISLFAHDFLPEALGFNMAYESLPLHLLKTVKELRELRLNPYYFELHISIDNADSGHAAMAAAAVEDYIKGVENQEGKEAAHQAWKRVQAGYILAEGLPTTPDSPSLKAPRQTTFPRNETEKALIDVFAAKTFVAHKIHCNSRLRIGRRSLVDWLEPNAFTHPEWQEEFLHDLSNCKPWVVKGDSTKSKLVKELSWEGKMFGSFTQTEVEIVKTWIDALSSTSSTEPPNDDVYFNFTQRPPTSFAKRPSEQRNILIDYPLFKSCTSPRHLEVIERMPSPGNFDLDTPFQFDATQLNLHEFLPLFFTSPTLLTALPTVPVRASSEFGSAIVRVLRAQTGFDVEGLGVAGMDEVRRTQNGEAIGIVELGIEMANRAGFKQPRSLEDVVSLGSSQTREICEWMIHTSMMWLQHRDLLVGMSWGFMQVHEALVQQQGDIDFLHTCSRQVLYEIASRERKGLKLCQHEIEQDSKRAAEFRRGVTIVRRIIQTFALLGI